ncbi:hypothetical protein Tco_1309416 [Tanacetum coccineum]
MVIVRKGKQRGHLLDVGRVLPGRATDGCPPPPQSTVDPADVEKLKKCNKSLTKQVKKMMRLFRSDDKFSQMLDQFESYLSLGVPVGVAGAGMMSRAAMRTATRMRMMEIVRDSLGKVAPESIHGELSPSTYPGRHVARDWYPQRQIAREGVELSLRIVVNVVVSPKRG